MTPATDKQKKKKMLIKSVDSTGFNLTSERAYVLNTDENCTPSCLGPTDNEANHIAAQNLKLA